MTQPMTENYIRLPLSWLGADVYYDRRSGKLCYEAEGQHLVELLNDDFVYETLKHRPRPVSEGK